MIDVNHFYSRSITPINNRVNWIVVLVINYYEMQKNYRVNLNKNQIISDLSSKKYDSNQLTWISQFNIKRLIAALKTAFENKNDLNYFLEFYLHPDHFKVLNIIIGTSQLQENTPALLGMQEFLRLCNIFLNQCDREIPKLRNFALVKKQGFDNYYTALLLEKNKNLTPKQVDILLQAKKADLKTYDINCPNLCFVHEDEYVMVNLSDG